jgi:Ca2+-transporting ATPase
MLELFMDLAASATFVAEPQEKDAMKKPPADPARKFMDKTMLRPLFIGALSLFVAVTATYLLAYYSNPEVNYARTVAFATWMLGHVFLALNLRSENVPMYKQGVLSNKVMLLWALLAVTVLVVGVNVPFIQSVLQITSLAATDWALAIAVAFAATFWMEPKKVLTGKI